MSNSLSPKEVFFQLRDCVIKFDADGQAELFDEDGIWELPFAPDPIPKQIIGREAIRAFGKKSMASSTRRNRRLLRYNQLHMYETKRQNLILVEFKLEGEVTTDGTFYTIPFLQVLRVKNGKIILLRDYFPSDLLRA